MEKTKEIFKLKKGMTLIELLVAVAIFAVVLMIVASIFITSVKNQRRDFVIQNMQDNARYMIEAMTKEIRTSRILSSGTTGNLDEQLKILNQENPPATIWYVFDNNNLCRSTSQSCADTKNMLNASNIYVTGGFFIFKSSNAQPRVTIVLHLVSPSDPSQPAITVQSTVASRND